MAIKPASLGPGTHLVHLSGSSGHARIVSQVNYKGTDVPILTVSSTVPKEVRSLHESIFLDSA